MVAVAVAVVVFVNVGVVVGAGLGGDEVGFVGGWAGRLVEGGDEVVGGSLVGGMVEEGSDFGFDGVLKGDLKGWDRVLVAVFSRRRFEAWMGDMVWRGGRRRLLRF